MKGLLVLLFIVVLLGAAMSGGTGAHTSTPGLNAPAPTPDLMESVVNIIASALAFFNALGLALAQFSEQYPSLSGGLACLLAPLAFLGLWVLGHVTDVLGLIGLQRNVRRIFGKSSSETSN